MIYETLRARLVHYNNHYSVIRINITRNKINYNRIIIIIYLFGDNTNNRILDLYSIFCYNMINLRVPCS
jgi:hypothetical protein